VYEVLRLMANLWHLPGISRKRNCTEASLTSTGLKPDFALTINSRLLLKGEEKTKSSDLQVAMDELPAKLSSWSVVYHGKVRCEEMRM
jgi:hypothetical protein